MKHVVSIRQIAKTGAQMSASREAATRPLEGKIKGREVRPGWGTVGALFLHTFHPAHCDVREHGATSRTRRFRNLFNVYRTSRSIRDEQRG
jgi:hypothetical protein